MRPRFSVVLPVHNRADVVGRAVASVVAQTFADLEVVVVDDGSTDDSVAAARAVADARVRIVRQEHAGTDAARVSGMRRARGTWVLFLDPDDELAPGLLARFGRLIDSSEAGLVSCSGDQVYLDGTRTRFSPVAVELAPGTVLDLTWRAGAAADAPGPQDYRTTVKACLRPGAFATTRELLRRAGAFSDPDDTMDPIPQLRPEHRVLSSTVHTAGTGHLDLDEQDHSCLDPGAFDPESHEPATATVPTPGALPVVSLPGSSAHHPGPDGDTDEGGARGDLELAELARRVVALALEDGLQVVHTPEALVCWNEPNPEDAADGDELRLQWALQAIDAVARTPIPDGHQLARYATIGGVAAARLRDHRESRRLFRLARQAIPDVAKHWVRWLVACVPLAADRIWEPTPAPGPVPSTSPGDELRDGPDHQESGLSQPVLAR